MEQSKVILLKELICVLEDGAARLRAAGLPEATLSLDVARLDLQTRLHGVTTEELRELCEAIEERQGEDSRPRAARADAGRGRGNVRRRLKASGANVVVLPKDNRHA